MRQAGFATVAAIRMQASMNLKCIPLLAMALLLPTASPAAAETIDIAIGHQSMCTDTYTGGIVIKELKLLEKQMLDAARNLEFEKAAELRDRLHELKEAMFGVQAPIET